MSLSIIVCATSGSMMEKVRQNISSTIGPEVEYEIIEIWNVENPRPIVRVYNEGARRAKFPNLLFLHQDAGFVSKDWWRVISRKLAEPDCGVIGFAGTKVMFNVPSGWGVHGFEWMVLRLEEKGQLVEINCKEGSDFEEVVALDGFAMFVRKDVWERYPFDEENVKGFHCYDIDFSLMVGSSFRNYVCTDVLLYHLSSGKFDVKWYSATLEMFKNKWNRILPRFASDVKIPCPLAANLEERAWFRMVKFMYNAGIYDKEIIELAKKYPLTYRSFEHRLKLMFYKMKYRNVRKIK